MPTLPSLRISVPASTANLGPGFDIWGIALDLRNEFICDKASRSDGSVKLSFFAGQAGVVSPSALPKKVEPDNLFVKAYTHLMKKAGQSPQSYDVQIMVNVPFSRGLGSSSTAILAGLTLANETLRREYQMAYRIEQILDFALEFEPHPDNLTAALYGGWNLCLPADVKGTPGETGPSYMHLPLPVRAPVKIAGVIPDLKLETRDSRQLIPVTISRADLTFQTSRVAALVSLLSRENLGAGQATAFRAAMEDRMHTTQRAHLIPGMFEIFEDWYRDGALGCFLSGAGSTLLAFWPQSTDIAALDLGRRLREKKIPSLQREFQIDQNGLMVLA
ncbi:MAG: homoserine kinase [Spirochaetes bacterium]|nr:homoserine kinase [Spirochaetota bacterium]